MAIVKITKKEAAEHVAKTDWTAIDAMTDEDIARQIAENPDAAPELTEDWFERATVMDGARVVRRGRPKSENSKKLVSLRLDPDVIERFRATGPGWQARINETLRSHLPD